MRLGDRGHEPLASGHFADDAFGLDRKAHESDVDPAPAEGLDLSLRREVLKEDLDRRRVLPEEPEGLAQERPVGLRRNADDQLPGFLPRRLPRQARRALGRGQNPARFPEEPISRRRELDVTPDAPQKIDLELGLEIPDLLAQGRLGGVETVRGAAEVEVLGDRDEVAKVPQLHEAVPFIAPRCRFRRNKRLDLPESGAA